jgi:hypothetical protein
VQLTAAELCPALLRKEVARIQEAAVDQAAPPPRTAHRAAAAPPPQCCGRRATPRGRARLCDRGGPVTQDEFAVRGSLKVPPPAPRTSLCIAVVRGVPLRTGALTLRVAQTREITATYTKDDAVLEVVLRVPPSYPLRAVEVDGTRRVGVSEGRWKKWALSMRTLLDNKDGALLDAILLWKRNIDQVFEDVEECPICYTVLHLVNNSLPRMACHTCRNKFHSACLSKWFNTSNKSTCPLCQSPWYS